MAANEAVGEFANMGIGLGVMTGVGGAMSSVMTDALAQTQSGETSSAPIAAAAGKYCHECGYRFIGAEKFCPECGTRRQ